MSTKNINYINSDAGRRIGFRPQQRDDPDIITEKSGAVLSGCAPSPLSFGFRGRSSARREEKLFDVADRE